MDVAFVCAHVQPLALQRQVDVCYPAKQNEISYLDNIHAKNEPDRRKNYPQEQATDNFVNEKSMNAILYKNILALMTL